MGRIIFGKVGLTDAGVYEAGRTYKRFESVSDKDSSYYSLKDNNIGHPLTDITWWKMMASGKAATRAAEEANKATEASKTCTTQSKEATSKALEAAKKATTYKPSVTPEGDISWTNELGFPNPETVNVKGPKGDSGATLPSHAIIAHDFILDEASENKLVDQATIDRRFKVLESMRTVVSSTPEVVI